MTYSAKTQRAIRSYGIEVCIEACRLNDTDGEGASTVAMYLQLEDKNGGCSTAKAAAAIDAGREINKAAMGDAISELNDSLATLDECKE
jgi:hypothetical protein